MPDIEFVKSPRTENDRLRHTRGDIACGFFVRHGFVVLPKKSAEINENIQVIYPLTATYTPVDLTKWQLVWEGVGEAFFRELETILPGASSRWKKLVVKVTSYGTISSSASDAKYRRDRGVFYLREDVDISHLPAMIINHILWEERKTLGITWTKREAIMDFVMTRPAMRKLFPEFSPIYSELTRVSAKMRKESEDYIRQLGIVSEAAELVVVGRKLVFGGKVLEHELTKNEMKVAKILVEKSGEIVTYNEIADILWGEGEFRTFWAINKLVGRTRRKLAAMGVVGKIVSVRGVGYYIINH
jgi:hypothetical protein